MPLLRALLLFLLAGVAEIGGGWLVWQWLREGKGILVGVFGGAILFLYGVIPTWQAEPVFGRLYAAYGGIFVILSLLWGWWVDEWRPDRFDILGAAFALTGVAIIMWGRVWFGAGR
ncbi:MAG TPA: YnfA family protein [Ardenticatenaceae bacterium]|nr:YnfA family protein [Ardenticatenaceae bacterium]